MVDTPVLVAGFDDVAMVRQSVQKGGCHFGIGEHGWPFSAGKVGCQRNGCAFVAFADELEGQAPAGVRQWEIAGFVNDHEINAGQLLARPAGLAIAMLGLQFVDQIHSAEATSTAALIDGVDTDCCHKMRLAGAGSANTNAIPGLSHEIAIMERAHDVFVDGLAMKSNSARDLERGNFAAPI